MKTRVQTPDAELFRRARNARDAFDEIVRQFHPMVYAVAYAHLGQRELAEDVAQEVFLRAYLHLGALNEPAKLGGWLAAIARNVAENWRIKGQTRSRIVAMIPLDDLKDEIVDSSTSSRDHAAARQESAALHRAIANLPGEHREIVFMHYLAGLSKSDIAQRLGLYPSSVGRRIEKALVLLRRELGSTFSGAVEAARPRKSSHAQAAFVIAVAAALPSSAKAALVIAVSDTASVVAPASAMETMTSIIQTLKSEGKASMIIKGSVIVGVLAAIISVGPEPGSRTTAAPAARVEIDSPRRTTADFGDRVVSSYDAPAAATEVPAEAPPEETKFEILGVREMEHARIQSKHFRIDNSPWMSGAGWVENSWGHYAGDSIEWDIDLKDPITDLKLGMRYCFDLKDLLNGQRKFTVPHVLHLIIDNGAPIPVELGDTGGWNHAAIHTVALPVMSPGSHTFKLAAPADWSDTNLDCVTFYRGNPPKGAAGPLRPMRLATSKAELVTVCASPTANLGEDPSRVAATFAQLREMMAVDYGSGPQGTIYVHFADPLHWEFTPIQMGWLPTPNDRRGYNSNAHRQTGRVVKNHWGIYMRADGDPFDRAEWCWAMAEYFGTRDVPDWFRHSSARVSGLLDWLPSLDESTTESEDVAAAQLIVDARAFLGSDEETDRLEVVHAAARDKYGKDLFRKFWKLVHSRPTDQAGPIDKIAVMGFLSEAAGGEDVTPLYRRWKGFATEGPVDPLAIGEIRERTPSRGNP